jgi:hypothetical protein
MSFECASYPSFTHGVGTGTSAVVSAFHLTLAGSFRAVTFGSHG